MDFGGRGKEREGGGGGGGGGGRGGGPGGGGRGGVTVSRPREIVPMNLQMVDVVRDIFVLCCVVLCYV